MSGPSQDPTFTERLVRAGVDLGDPRLWVAVHEAGHALRATRLGIVVNRVSIIPDNTTLGRVQSRTCPPTHERDTRASGFWWRSMAEALLAGDRAVRLLDPAAETCTGAECSDYSRAVRLIEAVQCDPASVEISLYTVSNALDSWLAKDEVQQEVVALTVALLAQATLTGDRVRDLVANGKCGAEHSDGHRCDRSMHPIGQHYCSVWILLDREVVRWEGFPSCPKVPERRRSTHFKRVRSAYLDDPPPPRKRGSTSAQAAETRRSLANGETPSSREQAALRAYLDDRAVAGPQGALPVPGCQDPVDRHGHVCPQPQALICDLDGYWCQVCAFEVRTPDCRSFLYQVVRIRAVFDAYDDDGDGIPEVVAVWTDSFYATADQAATHLRLARADHDPGTLEVRRFTGPRAPRRTSRAPAEWATVQSSEASRPSSVVGTWLNIEPWRADAEHAARNDY